MHGLIDNDRLLLEWSEAPWDTRVYGRPVLQVTRLEVRGPASADDAAAFLQARKASGARLVSCRLPGERLRESMFLEDLDFRFVEMLYLPEIECGRMALPALAPLQLARATRADLPAILSIAGTAFRNERFHVDPRLPIELADVRYQNWAASALEHPRQRLEVLKDDGRIVAFFVTELLQDATCYWHLNAVAPSEQGRGFGRRAWVTMMRAAAAEGATRVRSSIVARNHRVLNLYARLGFRFPPPLMTFHWVAPGD